MIRQTEQVRQLIQLLELVSKTGRPAKPGDEYGLVPLDALPKKHLRKAKSIKNK